MRSNKIRRKERVGERRGESAGRAKYNEASQDLSASDVEEVFVFEEIDLTAALLNAGIVLQHADQLQTQRLGRRERRMR